MDFPFPFFGSGNASYFEWFEMWIWFEKPVPAKARARLLKKAPGPCKQDASWPLPNLLWAANGDQFIGLHIINAYPDAVDPAAGPEGADDDDDDLEARFIFASGAQEQAFNHGIESWLQEMHKTHPIMFAARAEDAEAGGTQLDVWHAQSVAEAAKLLPLFEAQVGDKNEHARYPITLAVSYAMKAGTMPPLSPALAAWLDSEEQDEDEESE